MSEVVYRFADRTDPSTLQSALGRSGRLARARVSLLMRFAAYRAYRADRHVRGDTIDSPFVSVIRDPARLAVSTDPWASTIATSAGMRRRAVVGGRSGLRGSVEVQ